MQGVIGTLIENAFLYRQQKRPVSTSVKSEKERRPDPMLTINGVRLQYKTEIKCLDQTFDRQRGMRT